MAALQQRADVADRREVDVALPGGTLRIGWPDDAATITMSGPATFVFEGEYAL
jgi:diaminopimelate epimerase